MNSTTWSHDDRGLDADEEDDDGDDDDDDDDDDDMFCRLICVVQEGVRKYVISAERDNNN